MTEKSLKVCGWGTEGDRWGTLACSPSPVPLRWHVWASQGHSRPSTKELHHTPGLGREEGLGLHAETSWEEKGTRWALQKKPGSPLNDKDNHSDGGHTDRSLTPRVHFSSRWKPRGGKEEVGEALLLHPWWLLSRPALKAEKEHHGGQVWTLTAGAGTALRCLWGESSEMGRYLMSWLR